MNEESQMFIRVALYAVLIYAFGKAAIITIFR